MELEHRMKTLRKSSNMPSSTRTTALTISPTKSQEPGRIFPQIREPDYPYGGARRMLEQAGIKLKGLNVDKLRAEYQALETRKKN